MGLEEFGGGYEQGSEQQGNVAESGKEQVSQAEIAQVEKQQKKARQIRGQIAQKKKNDTAIANFIAFLMKQITDDRVLVQLYHVFFIAHNSNNGAKQLPTIVHGLVLVGLFAPFYHQELHKYGLDKTFDPFGADTINTLDLYLQYIPTFVHTYNKKVPLGLDKKQFNQLLVLIVRYFGRLSDDSEGKKKQQILSLSVDV